MSDSIRCNPTVPGAGVLGSPSIVGSYSSTKWLWISWIVKHDFPTPPPPTTTSLYSRRNCSEEHGQPLGKLEILGLGAIGNGGARTRSGRTSVREREVRGVGRSGISGWSLPLKPFWKSRGKPSREKGAREDQRESKQDVKERRVQKGNAKHGGDYGSAAGINSCLQKYIHQTCLVRLLKNR